MEFRASTFTWHPVATFHNSCLDVSSACSYKFASPDAMFTSGMLHISLDGHIHFLLSCTVLYITIWRETICKILGFPAVWGFHRKRTHTGSVMGSQPPWHSAQLRFQSGFLLRRRTSNSERLLPSKHSNRRILYFSIGRCKPQSYVQPMRRFQLAGRYRAVWGAGVQKVSIFLLQLWEIEWYRLTDEHRWQGPGMIILFFNRTLYLGAQ